MRSPRERAWLVAMGKVEAVRRTAEVALLGLSACGYPITRAAVSRWGVGGAVLAEAACAGLAIRDASMLASGVAGRLRGVPAALLHLELTVAVAALLTGLPQLQNAERVGRVHSARTRTTDMAWHTAVATMFAVHTLRFGIYLRPDQGRRAPQPEVNAALASLVPPARRHQAASGWAGR